MSKSELKDILIAMEEKIVKLREVSGLKGCFSLTGKNI